MNSNPSHSPLSRIQNGAVILGLVVVASTFGYRLVGGYSWVESLWIVVITISTVGFGERSQQPESIQLLSIAVILAGVSAAAYTCGGFLQLLLEGEVDRVLGKRKMSKEIASLKNHVVICGYGRMGQDLSKLLKHRNIPLIAIDRDPEKVAIASQHGVLCLTGDATLEDIIEEARIREANALVTALTTDAENVFITLTARNLCPQIQIIAKADHESSYKKLRQAGANRIVMPMQVGAQHMERMITRPNTADLVELFAETSQLDIELDELKITPGSALDGKTIAESDLKKAHRILVVGIKTSGGEFLFNPEANHLIQAGDTLLLMGNYDSVHGILNG